MGFLGVTCMLQIILLTFRDNFFLSFNQCPMNSTPMNIALFLQIDSPKFGEYFSGNNLLPGSQPAAHCYCGHQFGNFSGQLGDGCAQ